MGNHLCCFSPSTLSTLIVVHPFFCPPSLMSTLFDVHPLCFTPAFLYALFAVPFPPCLLSLMSRWNLKVLHPSFNNISNNKICKLYGKSPLFFALFVVHHPKQEHVNHIGNHLCCCSPSFVSVVHPFGCPLSLLSTLLLLSTLCVVHPLC